MLTIKVPFRRKDSLKSTGKPYWPHYTPTPNESSKQGLSFSAHSCFTLKDKINRSLLRARWELFNASQRREYRRHSCRVVFALRYLSWGDKRASSGQISAVAYSSRLLSLKITQIKRMRRQRNISVSVV